MSKSPARTDLQAAPVAARGSLLMRARHLAASGPGQLLARAERGLMRAVSRLRSTGTPGLAGLGLLVLALLCIWTVIMPQRDGLTALRDELALAQARSSSAGASPPATPARQSSEFVRQLPTRLELPGILGIVLKQAEAASLSLETGSYEWKPGKDGGPGQYRIVLPVRGSYPNIRQFVEATLVAVPAVALESLRFARDEISESAIDADISFVVFVRES